LCSAKLKGWTKCSNKNSKILNEIKVIKIERKNDNFSNHFFLIAKIIDILTENNIVSIMKLSFIQFNKIFELNYVIIRLRQ
jgi:hypothetical protein